MFGSSSVDLLTSKSKCRFCTLEFSNFFQLIKHESSHAPPPPPKETPSESEIKPVKEDTSVDQSSDYVLSEDFDDENFEELFSMYLEETAKEKSSQNRKPKERVPKRDDELEILERLRNYDWEKDAQKFYSIKINRTGFKCIRKGCGKCFESRWALFHHIMVHDNEKPYKCQFCDLAFNQPVAREKHETEKCSKNGPLAITSSSILVAKNPNKVGKMDLFGCNKKSHGKRGQSTVQGLKTTKKSIKKKNNSSIKVRGLKKADMNISILDTEKVAKKAENLSSDGTNENGYGKRAQRNIKKLKTETAQNYISSNKKFKTNSSVKAATSSTDTTTTTGVNISNASISKYDLKKEKLILEQMRCYDFRGDFVKSGDGESATYTCLTCSQNLKNNVSNSNYQLKVHDNLHKGETPFCCAYCAKEFPEIQRRNRHEVLEHAREIGEKAKRGLNQPTRSTNSNSISKDQKEVIELLISEDKIKKFEWVQYFDKIPDPDGKNPPNFECKTCHKAMNNYSRRQLYSHKLEHDGLKFGCRFCPKFFTSFIFRNGHESIHPGARVRSKKRIKIPTKHIYYSNDPKEAELISEDKIMDFDLAQYFDKITDEKNHSIYHCKTCQKVLNHYSRRQLYSHKLFHDGIRFGCRFCSTIFISFITRDIHESTHSDTKIRLEKLRKSTKDRQTTAQIKKSYHKRGGKVGKSVGNSVKKSQNVIQANRGNRSTRIKIENPPIIKIKINQNVAKDKLLNKFQPSHYSSSASGLYMNSNRKNECTFCKKVFNCKGNVLRHVKLHCTMVPAQIKKNIISRNINYTRYLENMKKPFKCEFCSIYFAYPENLKRHQMNSCKGRNKQKKNGDSNKSQDNEGFMENSSCKGKNKQKTRDSNMSQDNEGLMENSCELVKFAQQSVEKEQNEEWELYGSRVQTPGEKLKYQCLVCQEFVRSSRSLKIHNKINHGTFSSDRPKLAEIKASPGSDTDEKILIPEVNENTVVPNYPRKSKFQCKVVRNENGPEPTATIKVESNSKEMRNKSKVKIIVCKNLSVNITRLENNLYRMYQRRLDIFKENFEIENLLYDQIEIELVEGVILSSGTDLYQQDISTRNNQDFEFSTATYDWSKDGRKVIIPGRVDKYQCLICNQCLKSKMALFHHQSKHTGKVKNPYSCRKCGKKFTQPPARKRHVAICISSNKNKGNSDKIPDSKFSNPGKIKIETDYDGNDYKIMRGRKYENTDRDFVQHGIRNLNKIADRTEVVNTRFKKRKLLSDPELDRNDISCDKKEIVICLPRLDEELCQEKLKELKIFCEIRKCLDEIIGQIPENVKEFVSEENLNLRNSFERYIIPDEFNVEVPDQQNEMICPSSNSNNNNNPADDLTLGSGSEINPRKIKIEEGDSQDQYDGNDDKRSIRRKYENTKYRDFVPHGIRNLAKIADRTEVVNTRFKKRKLLSDPELNRNDMSSCDKKELVICLPKLDEELCQEKLEEMKKIYEIRKCLDEIIGQIPENVKEFVSEENLHLLNCFERYIIPDEFNVEVLDQQYEITLDSSVQRN